MAVRCVLLGFAAGAAGFQLAPGAAPRSAAYSGRCSTAPCCLLDDEGFSRRAALAGALGVALGVGAKPAFAGYVTSLGIETTKPEDAERDAELLATKEVQKGIENIKAYRDAAKSLKSTFSSDTNCALIPTIRKDFDFSKVRDDLNVVSTVFDDQTQLTVDRLSRAILYDLTELENASRFKKGESERTVKKVAIVEKWFGKLDNDLVNFLAYFS